MIQYTVFYDALGHKEAVHEEKHFADYLKCNCSVNPVIVV